MDDRIDLDGEFDSQFALRVGRVALAASEAEEQLLELLALSHEIDPASEYSIAEPPKNGWKTGKPLAEALTKRLLSEDKDIADRYGDLSVRRNLIIHSAWFGPSDGVMGFRRREGTFEVTTLTAETLDELARSFVRLRRDTDDVIGKLMGQK